MASDRKEYTVDIGGIPHTLLLDDVDAKRYGVKQQAKVPETKESPVPKNKARHSVSDK